VVKSAGCDVYTLNQQVYYIQGSLHSARAICYIIGEGGGKGNTKLILLEI